MISLAVIEFGLLIVALVFSYAHVKWIKRRKERISVEEQINAMFNYEWDGSDEDELYALYRVRFRLLRGESGERKLQQKLDHLQRLIHRISSRPMRSRTYISDNGVLESAFSDKEDDDDDLLYGKGIWS
jgi:hypothetical protein